MNKKIGILVLILMLVVSVPVQAVVEIFDTELATEVYKFSEKDNITLPFVRFSTDRIIVDKEINNIGFIGTNKNIDIDSNMTSSQVVLATDTLRFNSIAENLAVVASNVVINGNIKGNSVIFGTTVTISEDAIINNDVIIVANSLKIEGTINANVIAYVNELNVTGSILKDLRCQTANLNLSENSNIQGKIYIKSENDIVVPNKYSSAQIVKLSTLDNIEDKQINFFVLFRNSVILGLLYLLLSTKTTIIPKALNKFKNNPAISIFIGFGSIVLSILVILIMIFISLVGLDIIGIPLGIFYVAFMFIVLILSTFIMGSLMTEYLYNRFENKLPSKWHKLTMAIIIFAILSLLPYIPVIGWYIPMLIYMISIGISVIYFKKDKKV